MSRLPLLWLLLVPFASFAQQTAEDGVSRNTASRVSGVARTPAPKSGTSPYEVLGYQRILAELGYGALFTAVMDPQTITALRDFQRVRRLPVTAILDELTIAKLYADMRAANGGPKLRPMLELALYGWESGYIFVRGVWRPVGVREPVEPSAGIEVTCIRAKGVCAESQASHGVPYTDLYDVQSWDNDEIVAIGLPGCAKTVLRISRVAKQVMMTSSPLSDPGCSTSREALAISSTIKTYELVDGLTGFAESDKKSRQAAVDVLKLTEAARKVVD